MLTLKRNATIAVVLIFFSYGLAFGQFNETIRTGRPGQAIGAFTTGQHIFQLQSGFNYFGSRNSGANYESDGWRNNTVVRYGLTELLELSGEFDYAREKSTDNGETQTLQGLDAFDIGMRYHILTGRGAAPNIGFQFRMRMPVLSKDYEIQNVAPRMLLVLSKSLPNRFFLITNWGVSWNGTNSTPTYNYVVNLSFPFTGHIGAFVENYGSLTSGKFNTNFDTGLAWLINSDLQLDFYGGYGNNHGLAEYFVSTGISIRTNRVPN